MRKNERARQQMDDDLDADDTIYPPFFCLSCVLFLKNYKMSCRGYAFVEFEDERDAEE